MAQNPQTLARMGGHLLHDLEHPFHSLHREVNRVFADIFHGRALGPRHGGAEQYSPIMPSIDVSETDGELRIRAELPGVNDSDINVSLDGDVLTIRGEKKIENTDDENYYFVERYYGTFQRALQLPCPVDPDKVRADFDNGVLTVILPKCAEQDQSRAIPVQRGGEQESVPTSEQPNAAQSKARAQAQQPAAQQQAAQKQGADTNPGNK